MATMQKLRAYQGPALFSYGFRPFFLFGAIYAGAMIPLWLAVFAGHVSLPSALTPRDWHVHEMLFGYVGAVIAGFLLTAVPNWTGRLPIQGRPLAILFATWSPGAEDDPLGTQNILLPLLDRPMLQCVVERLVRHGCTTLHVVLGDDPRPVKALLGDGTRWGCRIVWHQTVADEDFMGIMRRIGVRAGPIEDYQPLSLTTYATMAGIRNIKLTPLAAETPKVEKK